MDSCAQFLAVAEHRKIPARARSTGPQLRKRDTVVEGHGCHAWGRCGWPTFGAGSVSLEVLAGLHAVEASYVSVSVSSPGAFRADIVRSVWSSKVPLDNIPVVLNLLDGRAGVDPAFHTIWTRFRMMRRYLAHWPGEVPRNFLYA